VNLTHKPIEISDFSDWYRVCHSQELRKKPLGITLWDIPIVVFRTKSGKVATLEDRCTQRNTIVSKGNIGQDQLEFTAQGWHSEAHGRASRVPALPANCAISENLRIKSFYCLEQDNHVWVCLCQTPATERPLDFPYLLNRDGRISRSKLASKPPLKPVIGAM
jgi:renierapurpurin 18,18'-hydroxylase